MDNYLATELAYKNGYEAGKKAAIDEVFKDFENEIQNHSIYWSYQSRTNLLDRFTKFRKKYEVN